MKVYGIHEGCIYEGGGSHNVMFATKALARRYAEKIVAKRQKELLGMRKHCEKDGYVPDFYKEDWKEVSPDRWRGIHDEIYITTCNVITK